MRLLIQRVREASVQVDGSTIATIGRGSLIFVAAGEGDTDEDLEYCVDKTVHLRIFPDEAGQMNRSLRSIHGEALVVPQFTLYGNVHDGRRPSFFDAMDPGPAETMYQRFVERLRDCEIGPVASGTFGASTEIDLVNDGPVTIWVDSRAR